MMACKAWLFETQSYELAKKFHTTIDFKAVRSKLVSPIKPNTDEETRAFWDSSLCRILRVSDPRDQKQLGRTTKNFDEKRWEKLSMHVVVAGSVARAEADAKLADIYWSNCTSDLNPTKSIWNTATDNWVPLTDESMKTNQTYSTTKSPKLFVEGNPYDRIWGVGLAWNDKKIEGSWRWEGQNRLGKCHDYACRIYNEERWKKIGTLVGADCEG
jgi:predicted NAD-dependent protein-ADP-ribosyltransferase YbiA (DUF1768 family)